MTANGEAWSKAARREFGADLEPGALAAYEQVQAGRSAILYHRPDLELMLADLPAKMLAAPVIQIVGEAQPVRREATAVPAHTIALSTLRAAPAVRAATAAGPAALVILRDAPRLLESSTRRGLLEAWLAFYEAAGKPPLLALSSQYSPGLAPKLAQRLGSDEPAIFFAGWFRTNVAFTVIRLAGPQRRPQTLRHVLAELPGPALIFCGSLKTAREAAFALLEDSVSSVVYHAGLKSAERAEALARFESGQVRALVTTEFPNPTAAMRARLVLHYDLPASVEEYFFQAGASGDPRQPLRAVLLFARPAAAAARTVTEAPSVADAAAVLASLKQLHDADPLHATLANLAATTGIASRKLRTLVGLLKNHGDITETAGGKLSPAGQLHDANALNDLVSAYRSGKGEAHTQFQSLINYAESGICRRRLLWITLGQDAPPPCGICDNCRRAAQAEPQSASRARQWRRGDLVHHTEWGEGEIKQTWGDKVRVHFPGRGEKVLKAEYVRRI